MLSEREIRAVASLEDDLRRGMYAFIRAEGRPVTRDEAAAAVGISRKLAAFHLDKLVDSGLLRSHFGLGRRPRSVGRAPRLYEATDDTVSITIPDRRPDLLAELLLDAVVATGTGSAVETAATEAATDRGRRAGTSKRAVTRPGRLGPERALTLAESLLAEHGFEPTRETPTCVRLRNCPFHPLAARAPALVCGLNHAFVEGMLEGLGASRLKASLSPAAGHCCVRLDVADDAGR